MTTEQDISQLKILFNDYVYEKRKHRKPQVFGFYRLNSSNLTLQLNPKYYYDLSFYLVGTVTAVSGDVKVYITSPIQQVETVATAYINNTVPGWRLEGWQVDKILADTNTIGSTTIYVAFIGFDNIGEQPKLSLA